MNTMELERYMMSHPIIKPYFGGALSKDTLPTSVTNTPRIYIVNMQNYNQPGDHWIVIWVDTIPEYLTVWLKNHQKNLNVF